MLHVGDWSPGQNFSLDSVGSFLEGVFAPLAFLWLVLARLSMLNHEETISCGLAGRQPLVRQYPLLLPLLLLAKPKLSVEPQ